MLRRSSTRACHRFALVVTVEVRVRPGVPPTLPRFEIPPGVVHTLEAREYSEFLDFNDTKREADGELYEEDTIRVDDSTE